MGAPEKIKFVALIVAVALVAAVGSARAGDEGSTYAVMVFENRKGAASMEWMRVAVPFEIAEKLEAHPKLRPTYGTLVLSYDDPLAAADEKTVAAFATEQGVDLVWTGWVDRAANWDLQAGFALWRVRNGKATQVGEVKRRGDFKDIHAFSNEAIEELCKAAGVPLQDSFKEKVLTIPTDDHYAFTLFGRGLYRMHGVGKRPHLTNARKFLEKAVFIDPKLAEAHRLLAVIYLWKKKPAKAKGRFGYALDLRPDYYAALAGQGRVLYEAGKVRAAQTMFEKMLKQRPWDMALRFDLGKLFWENGDADAALAQLEKVVDADPKHLDARRVLVLVHASRGDGADLVKQLEAVAKLDPDDLETQLDLGAAYASVGRDKDAIATYEAIVDKKPKHLQALKFIGDLHRGNGDLKTAIEFYEKALEANSKDPRPYFLLGRAYVDAGDDDAARKIYLRAVKFKEYLPETYNNLGSIEYRRSRFGQARWYLKRAVRKRPDNPRFRYNLALVYSVLRQLDEAREHIDKGLALSPKHVGLHYLSGVIALRTGDADKAKKEFAKTIELDPDHEDAKHNLALLEGMRRRAQDGEISIELPQPAD